MNMVHIAILSLLLLSDCTAVAVTHNCIYFNNDPKCSDTALSQHYFDGDGTASSGADAP